VATFFVPDPTPSQRRAAIAVAAALIAAIGVVDYLTGPLLSLSIFYLVPVAWVAALTGRRNGIAAAGFSGAVGLLSDVVLEPHYGHRGIAAWNEALMVLSLVVIVELIHRVRSRAVAAAAAEQRGREFLAYAAHQLRTPLAGIRSTADALMLGQDNDPEQELLLAGMTRETDRAGHLVNSLLRVARIDQHEQLPRREVDIGALVAEEVERAATTRPDLVWNQRIERADLLCNPDAVREALANLLDNAKRHAASGVDVVGRASPHEVTIAVHDDGSGLPARLAEAAFERFVTLDGQGGSGLGLPIARGIVEAHGGTLDYVAGSFVMHLPRRS
jgi:signal transduction histidine kinase